MPTRMNIIYKRVYIMSPEFELILIRVLGLTVAGTCGFLAYLNISHAKQKNNEVIVSGSSYSLIISVFVGLAIIISPENIKVFDISYKAKKHAANAEVASKQAQEALALAYWNIGRIPYNSKEGEKIEVQSIEILKKVYGDEYKPRIKTLIESGYMRAGKKSKDFLKSKYQIDDMITPSKKDPFFEQKLKK